jgi:glycosyltransferase involved in cell wall biosynthesis
MTARPGRVSVVIPVYNGERYLGAAIESVLAQTRPPYEVLVVDDGSEDGSAAVARSYGAAVRYVHQPHQGAGGAARARNRGVELARGELLAFLDADDLWVPEKLELQTAALAAASGPAMVFGHTRQFISPDLDEPARRRLQCPPEGVPACVPGAMVVSRDDFLRVGPFEASWRVGEPLDWFLRATAQGLASVVLPEVLVLRRLHQANQGVLKREALGDYARILKASLDRRRALAAGRTGPTADAAR